MLNKSILKFFLVTIIAFANSPNQPSFIESLNKLKVNPLFPPNFSKSLWHSGNAYSIPMSRINPEELVGTWQLHSEFEHILVEVGSEQSIMNPVQMMGMEPMSGGLSVTGVVETELNYVTPSFFGMMLYTNQPMNYYYYEIEYPFVALIINPSLLQSSLIVQTDEDNEIETIGLSGSFSMNGALNPHQFSFSLSNFEFGTDEDMGTNYTFMVDGNISMDPILLLPDSLITIIGVEQILGEDEDGFTVTLNPDSTGIEIESHYDDYYGYDYSDTSYFNWYGTDDSLYVIYTEIDDYTGEEYTDTSSMLYNLYGDTLEFMYSEPVCEEAVVEYEYSGDWNACWEDAVQQFGITLTDILMVVEEEGGRFIRVEALQNQPEEIIPHTFQVNPAYPNPFNPSTSINYELPVVSDIIVKIYDIYGRLIHENIRHNVQPGSHNIKWDGLTNDGEKAVSGMYMIQIQAGNKIHSSKIILLK